MPDGRAGFGAGRKAMLSRRGEVGNAGGGRVGRSPPAPRKDRRYSVRGAVSSSRPFSVRTDAAMIAGRVSQSKFWTARNQDASYQS